MVFGDVLKTEIIFDMLRTLIIEDERFAQIRLIKLLEELCDDIVIVGRLDSVSSSVEWLSDPINRVDLIFMDVELSDGQCFEIYKQTNIDAHVVITTAYDQYAIPAFKVGCVDYLLKPIDKDELSIAIERVRLRLNNIPSEDSPLGETNNFKRRFAVKLGDKIIIVKSDDIAYFISEDKTSYIVTHDNQRHILDMSLDSLSSHLDPSDFFRLTRAVISSERAIATISKHFNSRLKINLKPSTSQEVYVSRDRVAEFIRWIERGSI